MVVLVVIPVVVSVVLPIIVRVVVPLVVQVVVPVVLPVVRIYGFKLEGGEWFKEGFHKLFSLE